MTDMFLHYFLVVYVSISALLGIGSAVMVFQLIGYAGLTRMFPEGKRIWNFPAQLASLAFFAMMVLLNPFM